MKRGIRNSTFLSWVGAILFYTNSRNNVCKTFNDYYSNRDANEMCHYNSEYDLETTEIIKRHGFEVETHNVTTKDGYELTMFRIPSRTDTPGKPIFLQHGYSTNSGIYVLTGKKSLAFILANQGYDVWLGNSRGTRYSMNHTNLGISEEDYWNFSFDELGLYDLPAVLNYISNKTEQKITYIGHSLGTLSMFVYGTSYPVEAYKKVDMFIALAPSVFLKDYSPTLGFLISYWDYIKPTVEVLFKSRDLLSSLLVRITRYVCFPYPFQMRLCFLPAMVAFGFNYGQHDPETFPIVLMQAPELPTVKMFSHGVQIAKSGGIAKFSYDNETNMRLYGSEQPPPYNFSLMKVPTYSFMSRNDQIVTKKNMEALYQVLPKDVTTHGVFEVDNDEFSHIDFVVGKDVVELVYNHLVNFLKALPK